MDDIYVQTRGVNAIYTYENFGIVNLDTPFKCDLSNVKSTCLLEPPLMIHPSVPYDITQFVTLGMDCDHSHGLEGSNPLALLPVDKDCGVESWRTDTCSFNDPYLTPACRTLREPYDNLGGPEITCDVRKKELTL